MSDLNNDIEAVRSAFCALAYASPTSATPVHTTGVGSLASKFGFTASIKDTLDAEDQLGEICNLGNGYWFPAPNRIVALDGWTLLLTANPTSEIKRCVQDEVITGGLGRFCKNGIKVNMPIQPVNDWLPVPPDLKLWTLKTLQDAKSRARPFKSFSNTIQLYMPWLSDSISPSVYTENLWKEEANAKFPEGVQYTLFRERVSKSYSKGVAFLGAGRVLSVCDDIADSARLSHGIDQLLGVPLHYHLTNHHDTRLKLRLPKPLPSVERRLFLAVAEKIEGRFEEYLLPQALFSAVKPYLSKLGYMEVAYE